MSTDIVKVVRESRELDKYRDPAKLRKEAVPYAGQARKHPSDATKIFLRLDPLSSYGLVLEFKVADILYAEEMSTISDNTGRSFNITKLWIRKGSIGIKLEPFSVVDLSEFITDSYL